jgi:hypothetical protein
MLDVSDETLIGNCLDIKAVDAILKGSVVRNCSRHPTPLPRRV